jgi:SAM-dependent methyltransferase
VTSLTRRPRIRNAVERAARRALRAIDSPEPQLLVIPAAPSAPEPPPPPPPAQPPGPTASDFVRTLSPGALTAEDNASTGRLFARLDADDIAEVERAISGDPEALAFYEQAATPYLRQFLLLCYGLWYQVPAIAEKSGLSPVQPPEDVHAMARGPMAAAGGLYEADMVVNALASAGVEMSQIASALDFGCSSARVVRVLQAAYPNAEWYGCDPNEPAIAWASENLPGIGFFVSADDPPLAFPDESLDLVYAISIWSHFAPALGLRWFEEMRRLIRPGGHLMCTTHGLTSVAFYALQELRAPEQSKEIADALYSQGWWYKPEFGEEGDWGVVNPDWGTAFLSPEWLLAQLCPRWRVVEFAPGRNQENQDVYVLERV